MKSETGLTGRGRNPGKPSKKEEKQSTRPEGARAVFPPYCRRMPSVRATHQQSSFVRWRSPHMATGQGTLIPHETGAPKPRSGTAPRRGSRKLAPDEVRVRLHRTRTVSGETVQKRRKTIHAARRGARRPPTILPPGALGPTHFCLCFCRNSNRHEYAKGHDFSRAENPQKKRKNTNADREVRVRVVVKIPRTWRPGTEP
jgi:hypothetical protein